MQLTKNFKLEEFLYSDFFTQEEQQKVLESFYNEQSILLPNLVKLANQLQILRDYLNEPIIINIAYRPKWYELSRGRDGNSQHVLFKAADIRTNLTSIQELGDIIDKLTKKGDILQGGIGFYRNFVHYDIRKYKARWRN